MVLAALIDKVLMTLELLLMSIFKCSFIVKKYYNCKTMQGIFQCYSIGIAAEYQPAIAQQWYYNPKLYK